MRTIRSNIIFIAVLLPGLACCHLAVGHLAHHLSLLWQLVQLFHHFSHVTSFSPDFVLHGGELLLQRVQLRVLLVKSVAVVPTRRHSIASSVVFDQFIAPSVIRVTTLVLSLIHQVVLALRLESVLCPSWLVLVSSTLAAVFANRCFHLVLVLVVLEDSSAQKATCHHDFHWVVQEPLQPRVVVVQSWVSESWLDCQDLAWAVLCDQERSLESKEVAQMFLVGIWACRQLVNGGLLRLCLEVWHLVVWVAQIQVQRSVIRVSSHDKWTKQRDGIKDRTVVCSWQRFPGHHLTFSLASEKLEKD